MTLRRPFAQALPSLAAVAILATTSTAAAGNDDELLNGPQAAMMGGAVTATSSDGAALLYNPAGLSTANYSQVSASASAFVFRVYSVPKLLLDTSGKAAEGNFIELLSAPVAVSFVSPVGDHWSLGVGAFVTEVRNFTVNSLLNTDLGGTQESEWLLTLAGTSNVYNLGLGLGYRAAPNLRLGFSVLGIYAGVLYSQQFLGGSHDRITKASSNFATQSARAMADYFGARAAVGVQWEPVRNVSVGATILSPALILASNTVIATTASANASGVDANGNPATVMASDATKVSNADADVNLLNPTRIRLGVAYHHGDSVVSLDGDFQHGISDSGFGARDPVANVRLGGRFQVGKDTWLGAGAFTDLSSDPKPKDLSDTDTDFFGGVLGIEWNNTRRLAEDEDATALAFSTSLCLRYAYGSGKVMGLATDGGDIVNGPQPNLTDITIHEFGLYLGAGLYY